MPRKARTRKTSKSAAAETRSASVSGLLRDPGAARPLASLAFLSPLLVFYVVGLIWVRPDLAARADILIREGLHLLGVSGYLAPTWMVILILLVWHLVRRDPWEVSWGLVGLMAVETALLVVPLVALVLAFHVASQNMAPLELDVADDVRPWLDVAMTGIGAGIFEELLFRLLMVGGTLFLLRHLLKEQSGGALVAVVLIAAAVFAGAHVIDDPNRFAWDTFLFRAAAGIYLGAVFVYRGFGVTAGVHILFNFFVRGAALMMT
jgi:hypothetical protein